MKTILIATALLLSSTAYAGDVSPAQVVGPQGINGEGTAIDFDGAFPRGNTAYAMGGYRIYLIECDKNDDCVGPMGEDIGTAMEVAKELPTIKAVDARSTAYHCGYICTDSQGHVIGANPLKAGVQRTQ